MSAEPALKSTSWGMGQMMGFNHKGYNGPSYWQNHFDAKLSEQFQRFANSTQPSLEMRTAQIALLFLAYAPRKIDRIIAPRAATETFRIAAGLPASEELDSPSYRA